MSNLDLDSPNTKMDQKTATFKQYKFNQDLKPIKQLSFVNNNNFLTLSSPKAVLPVSPKMTI